MEILIIVVGLGSVIANLLIAALVLKLYTEYWKDITIKRRYENKDTSERRSNETTKG